MQSANCACMEYTVTANHPKFVRIINSSPFIFVQILKSKWLNCSECLIGGNWHCELFQFETEIGMYSIRTCASCCISLWWCCCLVKCLAAKKRGGLLNATLKLCMCIENRNNFSVKFCVQATGRIERERESEWNEKRVQCMDAVNYALKCINI